MIGIRKKLNHRDSEALRGRSEGMKFELRSRKDKMRNDDADFEVANAWGLFV
jgi:hypothetical protein